MPERSITGKGFSRKGDGVGKIPTSAHYFRDDKNSQMVSVEQEYLNLFTVYVIPYCEDVECSGMQVRKEPQKFTFEELLAVVEKAKGSKFTSIKIGETTAEIKTRCLKKFLETRELLRRKK